MKLEQTLGMAGPKLAMEMQSLSQVPANQQWQSLASLAPLMQTQTPQSLSCQKEAAFHQWTPPRSSSAGSVFSKAQLALQRVSVLAQALLLVLAQALAWGRESLLGEHLVKGLRMEQIHQGSYLASRYVAWAEMVGAVDMEQGPKIHTQQPDHPLPL